jgi:hypothetical protein
MVLVQIIHFPVAVVVQVMHPSGIFWTYGDWCDFCSPAQRVWQQFRLAIPVYVALFYGPNLFLWIAGRDRRVFRSIVLALVLYTTFATAFFLSTDRPSHNYVRVAALFLFLLALMSAILSSKLGRRAKGVSSVLSLVAGALLLVSISRRDTTLWVDFSSALFVLTFAIGAALVAVHLLERLVTASPRSARRGGMQSAAPAPADRGHPYSE